MAMSLPTVMFGHVNVYIVGTLQNKNIPFTCLGESEV
jgi:hypothetical protein